MASPAPDLLRPLLATEAEPGAGASAVSPQWSFVGSPGPAQAPADEVSWQYEEAAAVQEGSSATAAVLNLSTTIVGAGIMALPHVFRTLGIICGTAALFIVYALTHLSLNMLVRGTVVSNKTSFGALAGYASGPAATLTTRVSVILNNLGGIVAYLIIIGDVLAGKPAQDESGILAPLGGLFLKRWFAVGLTVVFVHAPLCFLRRLEMLQFTSFMSVTLSSLLIAVTLGVMSDRLLDHTLEPVNWYPDPAAKLTDFIKAIPVVTTAYVCHYNVHPVFAEMKQPTEQRMRRVVAVALFVCSLIYWLFAVAAYALFGTRTQDDVLMNYGRDLDLSLAESKWVERAVKVGFCVSLSCTLPLLQFSLRDSLFGLLGAGEPTATSVGFYGSTVALLAFEFLLSIVVPNISIAFSITGSTVAVLLGFIIPALVALGTRQRALGRALLIAGVVIGVVCFGTTMYGFVVPGRSYQLMATLWR